MSKSKHQKVKKVHLSLGAIFPSLVKQLYQDPLFFFEDFYLRSINTSHSKQQFFYAQLKGDINKDYYSPLFTHSTRGIGAVLPNNQVRVTQMH